jgi:hypothetical protein
LGPKLGPICADPRETIMADDQDGNEPEKPSLKVVSDNPNVDQTRPIRFAKKEAERTLAAAAATMLWTVAGSDGAAAALRNDMLRALLAEDEYQALSGQWLASWERKEVLALAQPEWEEDGSDRRYRKYERDCGMQNIVQGSLRLAAHQVLGEEPHFGGKYSERLIDAGMAAIERANGPPPPPPKPPTRKEQAERCAAWAATEPALNRKIEPPARKKRWSSRDSRSYLDPKPDE